MLSMLCLHYSYHDVWKYERVKYSPFSWSNKVVVGGKKGEREAYSQGSEKKFWRYAPATSSNPVNAPV